MGPISTLQRGEVNAVGKGLFLDASLNGVEAILLIDTGTSVSIISERIVNKWSKKEQCSIASTDMEVNVANDMSLAVSGEVTVNLKLGGHLVSHKFTVTDISNEVLLGLDFLQSENCSIDITSNSLQWRGIELPLRDTSDRQWSCRVTVIETVLVPAQTEMVIGGRLSEDERGVPYGMIEPALGLVKRNNLMLAPSLVSTKEGTVPVRLMNPTDTQATIYKGTTTGTFQTVHAVGAQP